jgi:hypothetical protein
MGEQQQPNKHNSSRQIETPALNPIGNSLHRDIIGLDLVDRQLDEVKGKQAIKHLLYLLKQVLMFAL